MRHGRMDGKGIGLVHMSELQAKFVIVVMFFTGFMAYAWPKLQEVKQCHDAAVQMVGTVSPAPTPIARATVK